LPLKFRLLRISLDPSHLMSGLPYGEEEIPNDILRQYIGGKGIGTKILWDEVGADVDPLSPKNKLIFVTGPATGTKMATANRYGVLFKSPLTGIYAESYSGGYLAPKIRASGFDIIIIEGRAQKPVYIVIEDGKIEYKNAKDLWGETTYETEDYIKETEGSDFGVLCIGPAGENLVKFACIENDKWRSAGRTGAGAVMGSKNLKAIAFKGSRKPEIENPQLFEEVVKETLKSIREKDAVYGKKGVFPYYGTPGMVNTSNMVGFFPTRYWSQGKYEFKDEIGPDKMIETILVKRRACWNCPFGCGKVCEVKDGPYKCKVEGPEYETIYAFGGLCDIRDIKAIAKINDYCDQMGLDTISAGNLAGFAIEAKKAGKIDVDFDLDYNNPDSILKLLELITFRKGIGNIFADGTRSAAEKLGLENIAVHVKGLDFGGYDPRAFRGMALSFAVSPIGPTHLRSTFYAAEGTMPDRLSYENKVERLIDWEDRMTLLDSLILCKFLRGVMDWERITKIFSAIFGVDATIDELKEISARINTLSKMYNVREGLSRKDDNLPDRFFEEALPENPEHILDRDKFKKMLDEYYELRGWDNEGKPKKETLKKLKLV